MNQNFLNLIKGIYGKPTACITLTDERLKVFTLRSGTRQERTFCLLAFYIVLGRKSRQNIRQLKEIKGIQIEKKRKEAKVSLFAGLIFYIEDPKNPHTRAQKFLLELINKFSKVAEHMIDLRNSAVFLYTSNE